MIKKQFCLIATLFFCGSSIFCMDVSSGEAACMLGVNSDGFQRSQMMLLAYIEQQEQPGFEPFEVSTVQIPLLEASTPVPSDDDQSLVSVKKVCSEAFRQLKIIENQFQKIRQTLRSSLGSVEFSA